MKLIDLYMRLMRMGLFGFFLAEDITKIDSHAEAGCVITPLPLHNPVLSVTIPLSPDHGIETLDNR